MYLSEALHLYQVADYWRSIIKMNEHQKERFTKRIISSLFNTLRGKKIAVLGFAFKKDTSDTRESPAITLVNNFIAEGAHIGIYDPRVKEQQIWTDLLADGIDPQRLKSSVDICQSPYDACDRADAVVIMTEWDEFSNKPSNHPVGTLVAVSTVTETSLNRVTTPEAAATISQAHLHTPPKTPPIPLAVLPQKNLVGHDSNNLHIVSVKPRTTMRERLDWARVARSMKKPMFVFDGRNILDGPELEKLGFRVEAIGRTGVAFRRARDCA